MNAPIGLERCLTFINCQLQPPHSVAFRNGEHRPAITLSRQSGSGGHAVAAKLVEQLQAVAGADPCPWTVADRNLVEKVLEDHHLPSRLARFMTEDRISELSDTMDELFGLHPPSWTLVRQTSETILRLADLGNVIIIGRAANIITSKLHHVFHVRLVGSLERRVKHMQELEHLSLKAARQFVEREDLGRRRYVKKHFGKDIEDPLLYHLVINTDLVPYEEAARMIAEAVLPKVAA
jgi:cytidylate kinase